MRKQLNYICLLFSFVLFVACSEGQPDLPEHKWLTLLGGTEGEDANGIISEESFVYVIGRTHSKTFPSIYWERAGHNDCFITKLDDMGNIIWSERLAGHDDDHCTDIISYDGYLYVTGYTKSEEFLKGIMREEKITKGDYDAFVVKLEDLGDRIRKIWATFVGGALKSDKAYSISAANGKVVIVGQTASEHFEMVRCISCTLNGYTDAFFAILSAYDGSILRSEYLGGSGDESAFGVYMGGTYRTRIYLTGSTSSKDFPLSAYAMQKFHKGGIYDAFIVALDQNGNVKYSTYWGGDGYDVGKDIAIDFNGVPDSDDVAIIVGETESSNLDSSTMQHTLMGKSDGFILKLTPNGHYLRESYFGGNGLDHFSSIAVDTSMKGCNMYITGETRSDINFYSNSFIQPSYGGGIGDAFLLQLCWSEVYAHYWDFWCNYSTYFGGSGLDTGLGVAYSNGNAWIAGSTMSDDMPTGYVCPICDRAGDLDAFVANIEF